MSEDQKMGLVIVFVVFALGAGAYLGTCALFVLTGN